MKKIALGLVGLCMSTAAFADSGITAYCWEEHGASKTPDSMAGLYAGFLPTHSSLNMVSNSSNYFGHFTYKLDVGHKKHAELRVASNGPTADFQVDGMVTKMVTETQQVPVPLTPAQSQAQTQAQAQGKAIKTEPQFETVEVQVAKLEAGSFLLTAPSEFDGGACAQEQTQCQDSGKGCATQAQAQNQCQLNPAQNQGQSQDQGQGMAQAAPAPAPEKIKVRLHDGDPTNVLLFNEHDEVVLEEGGFAMLKYKKNMANITVSCKVAFGKL